MTLFRGFPFLVGTSEVRAVDPKTGAHTSFIPGLTTAIDVLPVKGDNTNYFVLQHVSAFTLPPFESPWWLLRFETPIGPPTITVGCLTKPSSMTLDNETSTLYLTELVGGRIVAIPIAP